MPSDLSSVLALLARVERNAYFQTAELRTALALLPKDAPVHLRGMLIEADRQAFDSLLNVRQVREAFAEAHGRAAAPRAAAPVPVRDNIEAPQDWCDRCDHHKARHEEAGPCRVCGCEAFALSPRVAGVAHV